MLIKGQIVHDTKTNQPICVDDIQGRIGPEYRHYIHCPDTHEIGKYEIYTPHDVEEAKLQLGLRYIQPAPLPRSHHHKCGNWLSNHNKGCYVCQQ